MSLRTWITTTVKALTRPRPASSHPRRFQHTPITALAPSPLFDPLAAPPLPAHPDMALVMEHWRLHQKNFPGQSWPQFILSLEKRHAFFAEERRERAAKLAHINARPRFCP